MEWPKNGVGNKHFFFHFELNAYYLCLNINFQVLWTTVILVLDLSILVIDLCCHIKLHLAKHFILLFKTKFTDIFIAFQFKSKEVNNTKLELTIFLTKQCFAASIVADFIIGNSVLVFGSNACDIIFPLS